MIEPVFPYRLDGNTAWMTQQQMASVFDTTQQNISLQLKNIFAEGDQQERVDHKRFFLVGTGSISRLVAHYALPTCISVGYRVDSKRGVKFHRWATRAMKMGSASHAFQ